jgi:GTP-binding protein Era
MAALMTKRSGTVAIVGRPNVGKSTLLNAAVGQRVAITSPKPQTTRDRILGVCHLDRGQIAFLDTPGLHRPRSALGVHMMRQAREALEGVDALVMMVEPAEHPDDAHALRIVRDAARPAILAINKIDTAKDKRALLPLMASWQSRHEFAHLIPICARTGDGVARLLDALCDSLPEAEPAYPDDTLTDRPERFLAAELVREQILLQTSQEVPYASAVTIERFEDRRGGDSVIEAVVHVERPSQRKILVGEGGGRIREIGTRARLAISEALGRPVHLKLWVEVDADWSRDDDSLRRLGYG